MNARASLLLAILYCFHFGVEQACAQPDNFNGAVAQKKWTVLYKRGRPTRKPLALQKSSPLKAMEDFRITGPHPSHAFLLGNFASNAEWGIVDGYVQMTSGDDGALQLGWADQFELEGIAEHAGYGSWFMLLGWDEGAGHAFYNCNLKDSGSPWFTCRFEESKAVKDSSQEYPKQEWRKSQPFKLTIQNNKLSLMVGRFPVFDEIELEGYQPGRIVFGIHDTRYGTKPIRIQSLRIRALPAAESTSVSEPISDKRADCGN